MNRVWVLIGLLGLGFSATAESSTDTWTVPTERPAMTFDVHPGARVPLDLVFRNEKGTPVALSQYFRGRRPVILNLVYFQCPGMCSEVTNGLLKAMKGIGLQAGRDYAVLTISIDAREKAPLAAAKRKAYTAQYGSWLGKKDWAFLTGDEARIQTLTETVGFSYRYYADVDQFDHPAGLVILTASGQVAAYLLGTVFDPNELQEHLRRATIAP